MSSNAATAPERIAYLDGLRGIAVLAVVIAHALGGVAGPAFAPYIVNVGARGVDLFFVLSGFCLSLGAVDARGRSIERKPPLAFLISRFARVAPPYYAALGLFAVLALGPFGLPTAYGSSGPVIAMGPELLRESAFMLSPSPVYNASFWTLGIEMQWYLLCPLLIELFISSKPVFVVVCLISYALYSSPWSVGVAGALPCFMLGIVAASIEAGRTRLSGRLVSIAAAVTLAFAVSQQSRSALVDHGNVLWQVACFAIVLAGSRGRFRRVLSWKPLRMVGVASYSIYLVHQPFLAWMLSHGIPRALAVVAAVVIGFAFWFAIERVVTKSWQHKIRDFMLGSLAGCVRWTRKSATASDAS